MEPRGKHKGDDSFTHIAVTARELAFVNSDSVFDTTPAGLVFSLQLPTFFNSSLILLSFKKK